MPDRTRTSARQRNCNLYPTPAGPALATQSPLGHSRPFMGAFALTRTPTRNPSRVGPALATQPPPRHSRPFMAAFALSFCLCLSTESLVFASSSTSAPRETPILPVAEVRAGQRGHGESVFAGTERERFEVEILGVLRQMSPGSDAILARLSGHGLERTGVIAGMSGSPVWIDGRLVGAVAFAWPFASEAIAGITPIEQMRGIEHATPWPAAAQPAAALADLTGRQLPDDLLARAAARLLPGSDGAGRGAVVWSAAGLPAAGLERLRAVLPALGAVASGRTENLGGELTGGSSVAAVFIDGDLRLAATGTVTERSGDRVLAFGHPVAGLGEMSLPLAPAEVVTVLPSLYSSFKLANSGPVIGEFVRDHAAGTLGRLGAVPRQVPLTVRIEAPRPREFRLRLARVPSLLPLLAAIGSLGALDATVASGGTEGVDLELVAGLGREGELELRQSFDGPGAAIGAISWIYAVLDYLAANELAEVDIERVAVALRPHARPRAAALVGAHPARSRLAPGEQLDLFVDLRPHQGETERRELSLAIPHDLPAGRYTLLIGDGVSTDSARFGLAPVAPVTFGQARELLASLGSTSELVVLGVQSGRGLAVAGEILPRLPASVREIWGAAGGGGSRPLRLAVVQRLRFAEPRPLAGLVRVDVEIRRPEPSTGDAAGAAPPEGEARDAGARPAAGAPTSEGGPGGSRKE